MATVRGFTLIVDVGDDKAGAKGASPTFTTGFTLIETLVAVLLLSTAIAGPLTIASKGLSTSLIARDQIGAFFLAQDAVEYVRFARDSNKLASSNWLTGSKVDLTPCLGANGCYIDTIQSTVAACSGACPVLNYHMTSGKFDYYTYSSVDNVSVFQSQQHYLRTITLSTPVGSNTGEAALTVSVQWVGINGQTHAVTVKEDIFNWQ